MTPPLLARAAALPFPGFLHGNQDSIFPAVWRRVTPYRKAAVNRMKFTLKNFCQMLIVVAATLAAAVLRAEGGGDDASLFIFPYSDKQLIREQDLLSLDAQKLWQARNEIYARKGYRFESVRAQRFFETKPYYKPDHERLSLNDIERSNIALIERFEQYFVNYPEAAFESTYRVLEPESPGKDEVTVRDCPSENCRDLGRLQSGCAVEGDFRLNKDGWIYVKSSRCGNRTGPAGGYAPKRFLTLVAG